MKNEISNGCKSLTAMLVAAVGIVLLSMLVPMIYWSFEGIYLSTNNEFFKFIIRLGPICAIVTIFTAICLAAIRISPIWSRVKFIEKA